MTWRRGWNPTVCVSIRLKLSSCGASSWSAEHRTHRVLRRADPVRDISPQSRRHNRLGHVVPAAHQQRDRQLHQLRRMKSSLKLFPFYTASTVVNSFIISRIDYCNSLLANSSQCALNRLQRVMNAAARLFCHSGRRASVSGLLRDRLHWLRVPERVEYKVCLLVFKALHGMAPNTKRRRHSSFSTSLCSTRRSPSSTIWWPSCWQNPRWPPKYSRNNIKTNFESRAFAVARLMFWNRLPPEIRANDSLQNFKSQLKTYYFWL